MYDKRDRIEKIVKKMSNGEYKQFGSEFRLRCPRANDQNYHKEFDKTPSFFVNMYTGKYQCFACGLKGHYKSLLKLCNFDYYPEIEELENELIEIKTRKKREKKLKKAIELPKNCINSWMELKGKTVPISEYLSKRNVPGFILKELGILICKGYGLLENAIIYPIEFRDISFWGARIVNEKYVKNNPYFYPKDSPKEKVLYKIEEWISEKNEIILVEGIFDYIRMRLYGYKNTVPIFGKYMDIEQINYLLLNKIKTVYIMLDKDAKSDAIKLGQKLNSFFDVFICELKSKDPDLSEKCEIKESLKNSISIYDIF